MVKSDDYMPEHDVTHHVSAARSAERADLDSTIAFLQGHRRDVLRAIRACPGSNKADYWRWQGHAELARQVLERLGAEVPQ
jgi:hypothetical protein